MAGDVFDRCNSCGKLRYLHNGYCDECAGTVGAEHGGIFGSSSLFGPDFGNRPECSNCGGSGVVGFFERKCPVCGGTGRQ